MATMTRQLVEALEEVEWIPVSAPYEHHKDLTCPCCFMLKKDGHEDCQLDAALVRGKRTLR